MVKEPASNSRKAFLPFYDGNYASSLNACSSLWTSAAYNVPCSFFGSLQLLLVLFVRFLLCVQSLVVVVEFGVVLEVAQFFVAWNCSSFCTFLPPELQTLFAFYSLVLNQPNQLQTLFGVCCVLLHFFAV